MRFTALTFIALLAAAPLAEAATLPVGVYTLSAVPGTGIHTSPDTGTMTGILIFNPASTLTYANLTFHDTTVNQNYTFNLVGPTGTQGGFPNLLFATITDSLNTAFTYAFSIRTPGNPDGTFVLTCGVDCDTDADFNNGLANINEELVGTITPATPEPSSLILLGTGILGVATAARRRYTSPH